MSHAPRLRHRQVQLVASRPARPLTERGRIMYAEDIQALYGKKPNGEQRKTRAWIHKRFAPNARHKDGRLIYWWEVDAVAFIDAQKEKAS